MGITTGPPDKTKQKNSRGRLIQALIVVATFAAIVLLSIVTKGPHDARPTTNVIVVRIVLLAGLTVLYFVMLYYTMGNHRGKKKDSHRFFFSRLELLRELIGGMGRHRGEKKDSQPDKK